MEARRFGAASGTFLFREPSARTAQWSLVFAEISVASLHAGIEVESKEKMITRLLQFLLIAATFAGLVVFGLIRDNKEHAVTGKSESDAQESLPFPARDSPDHGHRGAAMSRL